MLVIVMLAACADKDSADTGAQTNQTSQTDESGGDPTGDPTAGSATDTGGTGSQGECDDYLACIGAVSPDKLGAAETAYGPGSACWQSGPELMQGCLDACAAGLSALGQAYPDEPKCKGAGSGTTTEEPTGGVMTDPTTVSTTDPTTVTGTDTGEWTTGSPETTDPSTTNDTQTSDTQTSDTTTGGGGYGNCGWDGGNGWYGCEGVAGLEDPDGITPIACPGNPMEGDPCQDGGPIGGVGCCMPNGDNFYCARGAIYLESCGG